MPARRSTRAQGKPAPNYNESALDLADRVASRKSRQPFLGEVRGETPKPTHVTLVSLGQCTKPSVLVMCSNFSRGAVH